MTKIEKNVEKQDVVTEEVEQVVAEAEVEKETKATAKKAAKKTVKEVAKAEPTVAQKKAEAVINVIKEGNINGIRYIEVDENNKIFESRLLIEGQALPLFLVVNSTVYSYIHVHLVTVTHEKVEKCNEYLNRLNESFPMLKYFINNVGNIVLTCSVPAADDKFDPALMFALVDQVKGHLEANYKELMQKIWKEK